MNPSAKNPAPDRRRKFLLNAAKAMIQPFLEQRAASTSMSHQPSVARAMLSIAIEPKTRKDDHSRKRGRCQSCPRALDQKVENRCTKCNQFVCKNHGNKEITYTSKACPMVLSNETTDSDC